MYKSDEKILELIEVLKSNSTIRFDQDFCDEVGVLRQTIYRIKKGVTHFTPKHIQTICEKYNVNSNWIFGVEKNQYRTKKIPFLE